MFLGRKDCRFRSRSHARLLEHANNLQHSWLQLVYVFGRRSKGENRDDEDTRDGGPPAPSGGVHPEEGIRDHAGMSCVPGTDQTSLTGKKKYISPIIDYKSTLPLDLAVSTGPCDLFEVQQQTRVDGVPTVPRSQEREFFKKQICRGTFKEDLSRGGRKYRSGSSGEGRGGCPRDTDP